MQNFYKTFKKILYAKAGFCRAQCKSLTQIIKDNDQILATANVKADNYNTQNIAHLTSNEIIS